MKNILFAITIIIFLALATPHKVSAVDLEAGSAAMLVEHESVTDPRVKRLESFLNKYNPEISGSAQTFVAEADKNGLDWKLVAAISGVESTFCRHTPKNSYNCWGWGIPTGAQSGIGFKSVNDGISTVSSGLRHDYIDRGLVTIEQIGSRYAASTTWAYRVRYFMNQIDQEQQTLVLSPDFLL